MINDISKSFDGGGAHFESLEIKSFEDLPDPIKAHLDTMTDKVGRMIADRVDSKKELAGEVGVCTNDLFLACVLEFLAYLMIQDQNMSLCLQHLTKSK